MSINVEKNHFYVKKVFDDIVPINPQYADLPRTVGTTLELSPLINKTTVLNKVTRPLTPKYGDSEPVGAMMQLYSGDINSLNTNDTGLLSVFRCNPDISITEGNFSLKDNKMSTYISRPANPFPFINEDFEGDLVNIGTVQRVGNNNVTAYSDPYITLNELLTLINRKFSTNFEMVTGDNRATLRQFELIEGSVTGSGRSLSVANKIKVYIKKDVDGNRSGWYVKPNGRQGTNMPYPIGESNLFPWTPSYTNTLSYNTTTTSTVSLEASPFASTQNTVFDDILLTRDSTNPYNADTDSPLVISAAELSTEKSVNSGQSFRLYHDWSYSPNNNKIQNIFGVSGSVNPQVARATINNIPFPPLPADIANTENGGNYVNCNHRGVTPEIQMSMNITKLEPAVLLNLSGASAVSKLHGFFTNSNTAGSSSWDQTDCGLDALSFLRSVTVTFSTHAPRKEDNTLDKFLDRHLTGFYNGQEFNVGGITFFKTGINGATQSASGSIIAMPLTTLPVPQATDGTATTDNTVMAVQGMAQLSGNIAGTSNDELSNVTLVTMGSLPTTTTTGILFSNKMPQFLEIPSNSWFTMRMFMDSSFYNNAGSASRNPYSGSTAYGGASPSTAEEGQRGSQMRIFFEYGKESTGGTGDIQSGWDFVDIPFPAKTGVGPGASYNWIDNPEYCPKYMTIWVQNYPWVEAGDTAFGGSSTTTSLFNVGDNSIVASGAAREVEVFIDNIKFLNFEPDVTNVTPDAYAGPLNLKPSRVFSPIGSMVSGSNSVKRWAASVLDSASLRPNRNNDGGGYMNGYNTGQYICFGFDGVSTDYFPTSTSDVKSGYILFNDFSSTNFEALSGSAVGEAQFKNRYFANPSNGAIAGGTISRDQVKATDGSTNVNIPMGGQMSTSTGIWASGGSSATQFDVVSGSVHTVTTGAATDNTISLGQGANSFYSTDGLRQKGFAFVSVSGTSEAAWSKRENILVSTKIKQIGAISEELSMQLGPAIVVQDPTIFNWTNPDETYSIYMMGAGFTETAKKRTGLKLNTQYMNNEGILVFTVNDWDMADNGSTRLVTEDNLNRLWIGPEKYWINVLLDSTPDMTPRKWTNICMVNEVPSDSDSSQLGSTYNEYLYNYDTTKETTVKSGLYLKRWSLRPTPSTLGDFVIRNEDNGFGEYDEDSGQGGEIGVGNLIYDNYSYIELKGLTDKADLPPGTTFPIYFDFTGLNSVTSQTISTDNNNFYEQRPVIYWSYKDLPPTVSNLSVNPTIDLLSKDTNLYDLTTENLNSVKFTWEEDNADDVWYRMLIIDDNQPIEDKYHKAKMWLPLNEKPSSPADTTSTRFKVHNPAAQTSGNANADVRVYSVLNGQAGYAAELKQDESVSGDGEIEVANGTNTALEGLDEFTLVVHWTPSSGDKGNVASVVSQTNAAGTAASNFEMFKNASNNIVVKLGSNTAMTGSTSIICDGETPVNLILTYNSGSSSPVKNKLYINGTLDVTANTSGSVGTGRNFRVGGPNNGTDPRASTGKFEEIIIYPSEHKVLDSPSEYIYNTVDELDILNTANVTKNARLFVYDYHNIRGTTPQEVGMSQPTSWRVTTL